MVRCFAPCSLILLSALTPYFARTGESILKAHGVEVVNLSARSFSRLSTQRVSSPDFPPCPPSPDLDSCKDLMTKFIKQSPEIWNEVSSARCGGSKEVEC